MAGKHSNKTNKGIRFRLGVLILIFAVLSFVIVAGIDMPCDTHIGLISLYLF